MQRPPDLPARSVTRSEEETRAWGAALGAALDAGDTVALYGELGSGKTVVAHGICDALGCGGQVSSPSFTIIHEYDGALPVAHCDLYRLGDGHRIRETGFEELFDGTRVVLVEWAERGEALLPLPRIEVRCEHGEAQGERTLSWRRLERPPSPGTASA